MRHFSRLFHSLVGLAVVAGFGSTGCVSGSSGAAGRDTLSAGCDTLGADSSALRAVAEHRPANGIYYWRTVFDPSAEETEILRDHQPAGVRSPCCKKDSPQPESNPHDTAENEPQETKV